MNIVKKLVIALAFLLAPVVSSWAQTAGQVTPGYLATGTVCATMVQPCFIPYPAGNTPIVAGSAVSSAVLKASPGNLYSAYATVTAPSWLMIFNSTTAPSNGSTTAGTASGNMQDCISIPVANSSGGVTYSAPEVFSVGITAVISSTGCGTLTLATVGYIHGSVQ